MLFPLTLLKADYNTQLDILICLFSELTEKGKDSQGCWPNRDAIVAPKLLQLWVEARAVGCIREVFPPKESFVPHNTNNTGNISKKTKCHF